MLADEAFLKKLQAAFKVEAEEHLQAMSSSLVELERVCEQAPAEIESAGTELVETIFREAHSLKGAARAVNFSDVEAVCQALEDIFAVWKRHELSPTATPFDPLYQALDTIQAVLAAAANEQPGPSKTQISALVQQLRGLKARPKPDLPDSVSSPTPPSLPTNGAANAAADAKSGNTAQNGNGTAANHLAERPANGTAQPATPVSARGGVDKQGAAETVRVPVAKLDSILVQAEEMVALKMTADRQVEELRAVKGLLDIWRKEWGRFFPEARTLRQVLDQPVQPASPAPIVALEGATTNGSQPNTSQPNKIWEFLDWNQSYLHRLSHTVIDLSRAAEQDQRTVNSLVDNLLDDTKRLLMQPFSTILAVFPKLVRDLCHEQGKDVEFDMTGSDVEIDKRILEEIKSPLTHLLRNSIDHGLETPAQRLQQGKSPRGKLTLAVSQVSGKVEIVVSDDGGGIAVERVKAAAVEHGQVAPHEAEAMDEREAIGLIFKSDVSTSPGVTELSGRGLGMAIVREKVENLGGRIAVETRLGEGTTFRISLPLTLATFRGIQLRAAGRVFVLPTTAVERVLRVQREDIKSVEGQETLTLDERVIPLVSLSDILELPPEAVPQQTPQNAESKRFVTVVVLGATDNRVAFAIDDVLDEQEVLLKRLGAPLVRVRNVAGATVLGNGQVVPILNVADLLKSAVRGGTRPRGAANPAAQGRGKAEASTVSRQVLVVDDSITSRMLLKNILESAGYQVKTAVDGMDALTELRAGRFDLLVTDIDMPRLNGLDLTVQVRADARLAELPVVLVTGRETREDRERGMDVGADAYVVKSSFDQSNLLEVVQRLL
jgi:two-component system chemotaxis sensor kinase CheA